MMNQEIRDKIRILAGEALAYFKHRKRHDGSGYWTLEEGTPEWVIKLVFEAHDEGRILPDDFRYLFIVEALETIVEDPEASDIMWEPDVYTSQLLSWLEAAPSYRMNLIDEEVSRVGWSGLFNALQAGQRREKEKVLGLVRRFLEKKIEEGEED